MSKTSGFNLFCGPKSFCVAVSRFLENLSVQENPSEQLFRYTASSFRYFGELFWIFLS